jgi:hypothetical protein
MKSPALTEGCTDWGWNLLAPHTPAIQDVLDEISRFRGRVLHAGGRRPAFARANGEFADDSSHDVLSYHVTVRRSDELVACVRLTPYAGEELGAIGTLIGYPRLRSVLGTMGLSPVECVEGSRWIVEPSMRGRELGRLLLVSLWAVGRWLGKKCVFGSAGTRDGQSRMIERTGGRIAPGDILIRTDEYDDDLLLMYFDLCHPPPNVTNSLLLVNSLLNLTWRTQQGQHILAS